MSSDLFRKYIDIVNENSQLDLLTEGMLDSIKGFIQKKAQEVVNRLDPEAKKKIVDVVSQALGKSPQEISMADITVDNVRKVAAAARNVQVSENWAGELPAGKHEKEPVPGTYAKNLASNVGIGGAAGGLLGAMGSAFIMGPSMMLPGNMSTLQLAAAGMIAIGALVGALMARGDEKYTGRFVPRDPKLSPFMDPTMKDQPVKKSF